VDPLTGESLIPGFVERREVLVRKPAEYLVHVYERTVWVSPGKTTPVATPWPARVLPKLQVDASVVGFIAAAHFGEHLPYYRLEQQLQRARVDSFGARWCR
jgi:transposase